MTRLLLIYLHLAIVSCSDSSLRDCRGIKGRYRGPFSPFWPPEGCWNLGRVYSKLFLIVPLLRVRGREVPVSTQGRYGMIDKSLTQLVLTKERKDKVNPKSVFLCSSIQDLGSRAGRYAAPIQTTHLAIDLSQIFISSLCNSR